MREAIGWVLIFIYIAALPYAIVLFQWLRSWTSLETVKLIPFIVIFLMILTFGFFTRRVGLKKIALLVFYFTIIVSFVYWLESNPVKYIHIPEYAFLTIGFCYLLSINGARMSFVLPSLICAILVGVFDEIHHGIHPERYYGWKDMVINICGALIGALFLVFLQKRPISNEQLWPQELPDSWIYVFLILLGQLIFSIQVLFYVVDSGSFRISYPGYLIGLNLVSLIGLFVYLARIRDSNYSSQNFLAWIFLPSSILILSFSSLLFANYFDLPFR